MQPRKSIFVHEKLQMKVNFLPEVRIGSDEVLMSYNLFIFSTINMSNTSRHKLY